MSSRYKIQRDKIKKLRQNPHNNNTINYMSKDANSKSIYALYIAIYLQNLMGKVNSGTKYTDKKNHKNSP